MSARFPYCAAYGAIGGSVSPMVLARMAEALEALQPDADVTTAQIDFVDLGKILTHALAVDTATETALEGPALRSVALVVEGREITLTPQDAALHPIARQWAPATLAELFQRMVETSADMSILAHGAPGNWSCATFDVGGHYAACAEVNINPSVPMNVVAHYGPEPIDGLVDTRRTVSGALFWCVASIVRDIANPAESGSRAEACQAVVAAVEASASVIH